MKSKFRSLTLLEVFRLFLGLAIVEGLLTLLFLFRIPSESRNAILGGYSLQRIGIGFVIFLLLTIFIILLNDSFGHKRLLSLIVSRLKLILSNDGPRYLVKLSLTIILVISSVFILFFLFPVLQRVSFFPNNYIFVVVGQRAGLLIGWIFLISLKALILYSISNGEKSSNLSSPIRAMMLSWTLVVFLFGYFALWSLITRKGAIEIIIGPGAKAIILSIWLSLWAYLDSHMEWAKKAFQTFLCISICLCVFAVSVQMAQWLDKLYTPQRNFFNLLAYAFLHGRLFLVNPPSTGYQVLHNGHWYVALPPFPALLMLPFIALWGVEAFNTTTFSLVLAATSAVLVYLILNRLIQLGWSKLTRSGSIWLTALFSFGTMYWCLSIDSKGYLLSQVVTVLFCALAFLFALRKYSPWIVGISLAGAIMTRPDIFVLWPALLAISIQLGLKEGKIDWKRTIKWGLCSAIPVILGVCLLLVYNFQRFGNFFDFGYTAVSTTDWDWIVKRAQKYGVFSPHFIPFNLYSMFLSLPQLTSKCGYYLQRGFGMSMFLTTPAIIYVFRKFEISWWTCGCWCSMLLSIFLLSMYSSNGALQYGYRYMLDFIIPAIMLIAHNVGDRISLPMKVIIIASILINYYGTISWFKGPC